jgi:hypothetical protein
MVRKPVWFRVLNPDPLTIGLLSFSEIILFHFQVLLISYHPVRISVQPHELLLL